MSEVQETAAAVEKARIRPNIASMVKTATGSYHKDDFIGTTLNGLTVDQVKTIATENGLDVSKYEHLNPGQQRMTLGNTLRKMTNMVDETGLEGAALDKAIAANVESEKIRDGVAEQADAFRAANEAAAAEKAAAKAAAKAPAVAEGEGDTQD